MKRLQIGNNAWIDMDRFLWAACDNVDAGTVVVFLIGMERGLVVKEKDWRDALSSFEKSEEFKELRHER